MAKRLFDVLFFFFLFSKMQCYIIMKRVRRETLSERRGEHKNNENKSKYHEISGIDWDGIFLAIFLKNKKMVDRKRSKASILHQ